MFLKLFYIMFICIEFQKLLLKLFFYIKFQDFEVLKILFSSTNWICVGFKLKNLCLPQSRSNRLSIDQKLSKNFFDWHSIPFDRLKLENVSFLSSWPINFVFLYHFSSTHLDPSQLKIFLLLSSKSKLQGFSSKSTVKTLLPFIFYHITHYQA